jgi:ABC-type dipeptide/oligopeptide/nickel transport system permease component
VPAVRAKVLSRYVAKRLLITIPQVFGITVAVWFLIRALPADPVARLVGLFASDEAYAQAERTLGLDEPVWQQFTTFIVGVFRGDLGTSWVSTEPVTAELLRHFPITLQLILLSFLFALLIGIPLGVLTAVKPNGLLDRGVFVYGMFAGAQPEFWWGLMFAFVFSYQLGIFPAPIGLPSSATTGLTVITGMTMVDALLTLNLSVFWAVITYYLLPALTLGFVLTGPIVKMIRQNITRVMDSDFVLYARGSGLPRRQIILYTLRNALAPVITLVGILFGFMLGGAVLIETVFSLNGLGQYAVQRTLALDFPAIQGVVLFMTSFSLFVYLFMDVLYALVDPRIKY